MDSENQNLFRQMECNARGIWHNFYRKIYEEDVCIKIGNDYVGVSSYLMSFISFFRQTISLADSYFNGKKIIFITDPNLPFCNKKSFEILYEHLGLVLKYFDTKNTRPDHRFWTLKADQYDVQVQLNYILLLDMITSKEETSFFLQKIIFSPGTWVKLMDYTHINPSLSFGEEFCAKLFSRLYFVNTNSADYELTEKAKAYYKITGAKNQALASHLIGIGSCHKLVYNPLTKLVYDMILSHNTDWIVFYNPTECSKRISSFKDKITSHAFSIEINAKTEIFFLLSLKSQHKIASETMHIRQLLQEKLTIEEPIII